MLNSDTLWFFVFGFIVGLITGGASLILLLSAAMLSSRISREEENHE